MDTLSTGIGGALLGGALPPTKAGPAATLAVTVASVVPDVDVVFDLFARDELTSLTVHRGFTHSLLGVALMAPAVALALWLARRDRNYLRLLALVTLGLVWHLFTDLSTSWGTMVYHPFSRARVSWDLLFILDFIFTSILLFPHLHARIYRGRPGAWGRAALIWLLLSGFVLAVMAWASAILGLQFNSELWLGLSVAVAVVLALPAVRGWGFRQPAAVFCRIGVVLLAAYLGVTVAAHAAALKRVKNFTASLVGVEVKAEAALPQPFSPWRWSGLVLTSEGVYQAWFNVFDAGAPSFEFEASERNEYVARAETLPAVQTYLWFARFPVARYHQRGPHHIVEYTDLRFRSPQRPNPFEFRVVFGADGRVVRAGFVP